MRKWGYHQMKIDKYSAILGNTVGFHDMSTLTNHRPVASLPFGGKYRLIDFPLSSLANAGIRSVFGIFQQVLARAGLTEDTYREQIRTNKLVEYAVKKAAEKN